MRLGVTIPDGGALTGDTLIAFARQAESTGLDSLWCFDAIGRGFMLPDPLIAVSVAASVTRHIEVGTCILQVPLRRPVELAHRILTAHLACRGRLALGVGAGSTKVDFDAVGVEFAGRMKAMEESLAVMRALWRGESVGTANLTPWDAARGGPRLLIGSWGGREWIPRAAREFDGWIASGAKTSYAALADGIARYRAAGGARAVVTNIVTDLTAPTTPIGDAEPFQLRCAPGVAADRLRRLADLGFDDAILVPRGAARLEDLRALVPITG